MTQQFPKIINENFHNWFENSKGVDGNNEPQVYYHKSRATEQFNVFTHEDIQKNIYNDCYGFYFVAEYHKFHTEYIGMGLDYYVYLKMNNPFYIYDDGMGEIKDMRGNKHDYLHIDKPFCEKLESEGHDSIILICNKYYSQYVVFNPNQIKSVFNNGEYSKETNDIFL